MPREISIGNGSLLVNLDRTYQIRDVYWPHPGMENHALGHTFHAGVWVDGRMRWLDDPGWQRDLSYAHETLVTDARLSHPELSLSLEIADAVDFHENLFVRRCIVANHADDEREVRLFFHHDFHIMGYEVGDTAYYEPERRAIIHYKGPRWFLANGAVVSEEGLARAARQARDTAPGIEVGVHQWSCGIKEYSGLEGTWRDAEDGELSGNPIAQGTVDSTAGFGVRVPARGSRVVYYWLCVGGDFETVTGINRTVRARGPQFFLDRTAAYWHLWLDRHRPELEDLPHAACHQYLRSLLVIRTQTCNDGAIIAASDSDIAALVRDTYSYMWPRDGALVADALSSSGYIDLPRNFFNFCARALTREGYLLHKYNSDGSLASSWHPWLRDGHKELPIQEDETALVIWALWRHFERYGDVEFVKPLYRKLITRAADFMASFVDPETGLPLPSYDLWEERHGVMAWTVGAVWGGLTAAANFAESFGETEIAAGYRRAADEMRAAAGEVLWLPDAGYFARVANRTPDGAWAVDRTPDASVAGLWLFGMLEPGDERIVKTMVAIRDRLWVKTPVGGLARYEGDTYQRVNGDDPRAPGNPWFITTLWLAEWYAEVAQAAEDLDRARELLLWACEHALPSGVLAEQVHPYTGAPLSVSPLTWSHAGFVSAVRAYLRARERMKGRARSLENGAINGQIGREYLTRDQPAVRDRA